MNKIATILRESMAARFLIPLGLVLVLFSIFWFFSLNKTQNYVEVEAVVSKTELVQEAYTDAEGNHYDETYKVFVKYIVDEKEYETEFGEFPGYSEGDKVTISYNPEKPEEISQPTSIIWPIVMLIGGIVALTGGIISAVNAVKKFNKMRQQEKEWENAN